MRAFLTQRPFAAALLAGAFAGLGQAPLSFPLATLLGLALWLWLHLGTATPRRAAWIGWGFGVGYFALTLHWILEPFFVDPATIWLAPFGIAGMSAGLALFWSLGAWIARRLASSGMLAALAWAGMIALAELTRSYIFTGFPWALIGHVWIGWPPMQLAAWVGPHGLTVLTLLLSASFVVIGATRRGMWMTAACAGLLLSLSVWLGNGPTPQPSTQTVRLVQPNAPQRLKWHPDHAYSFFQRAVDYTDAEGAPNLIIWPETAIPTLLEHAGGALGLVRDAADGVPVVIGIQRREGEAYYNSLITLSGAGEIADIYDKFHLVPFGEYMPWPAFWRRFGILGLAARADAGYTPGPGSALLDLGTLGKALPLICYEAIFPQHSRTAERPDWLLQITNDAWFGNLVGPYQHLAQARLRAVEQGLPMIRAANTGVSAVIDARGRIVADLALNQEGFVDVALPGALPPTFYARTGDAPMLIFYLLLLFSTLIARKRKRH